MVQQRKGGWRPPGLRNPVAFGFSIAGAVLVAVGLVAVDSVPLVVLGAGLTVVGWVLARRSA
ncbi:hypothetical protein [Micromonospora sp. NPDC093277]|uniref:hypothetical protein n=1 Tax=Micromonospora sp. NPDC093277 TaxID=3364291 RepID=UPI0037F71010